MFRLPVCPCCGTVYRYVDVLSAMKHKQQECYHCGKTMRIVKKGIWVLALITLTLSVLSNILIMNVFHNATVYVMFGATMCWIVAAYFMRPFFITFKCNEQKKR